MALPEHLEMNLINQPDLAQPIAVVCALLGVEVKLNRLQTLTIKETNRLEALKEELSNFGISADLTVESIFIAPQKASAPKRPIKTYNDHRMAMSFSLFASQFDIEMEEPHVVSKSYPEYFNQLLAQ
jgi:3-phosphoshikimate 1-carboxyvinyltransferase